MDRYLYEETRLNLVRRARNFAVASLSCSIILFSAPDIGIGLGFFAILFAILSKGYRRKMDKEAATAVKFAIAGIILSIGIMAVRIATGRLTLTYTLPDADGNYSTEDDTAYNWNSSELINKLLGGDGSYSTEDDTAYNWNSSELINKLLGGDVNE